MIAPAVLASGAAVGTGIALIVAGTVPTVPDLRAALARLDGTTLTPTPDGGARLGAVGRWWAGHAPGWAARAGLARCGADLALVGDTPSGLLGRKAGYALLGLAFVPVLTAAMALLGLALPLVIPALASLALATALFFVPDADLRRRAAATRTQMRRAVCVYLELVALERAADAGSVEALERAAAIGDGRAFTLIRDALLRAHLGGAAPWVELRRLSEQLRVPELGDVGDIMRLSGEDGAAVYATLRARAASLRTTLLAEEATAANAASEHMVAPVAFLGLAFLALLAYPAFTRILFG